MYFLIRTVSGRFDVVTSRATGVHVERDLLCDVIHRHTFRPEFCALCVASVSWKCRANPLFVATSFTPPPREGIFSQAEIDS